MAAKRNRDPWCSTADAVPVGAHLVTPRTGYQHHGIYIGNGRVIHNRGLLRFLPGGLVEEIPLERFAKGRGFWVKPEWAPLFSGAACVARARSRLSERRYRLWSNNCEHFSEWCISGRSRSVQVEAWVTRLRRLVIVVRQGRRISTEICAA